MQREARRDSVFHEGEQRVQERLGVRDSIEPWARKVVRQLLPAEHRDFYESLPFLVAAARDERGRPWATLLAGAPGFATSPDPATLSIQSEPAIGDALQNAFAPGADVGLLGIEFATRRRNRVNGRVAASGNGQISLEVGQSFGNCPQYISDRSWRHAPTAPSTPKQSRGHRLTSKFANEIRAADTFFIATGHRGGGDAAAFGMDASHRGGSPGFVVIEDDRTLVFPDYGGNNHFNTIGNLVMDARAGLLFVDFESGGLLQLTGVTQIDWDSSEVERHPGARRLIRFKLDEAIHLEEALPLRWAAPAGAERDLRLVERKRESDDIVSFWFESNDGSALPDFEAGQHLPIAVQLPERENTIMRTYSLSSDPAASRYRISVKRESQGAVSRHLHDALEVGAVIASRAPGGDFVLDHGSRPVVLVSAGVGATPMVSMLHALVKNGASRPVWYVHGARDSRHHALAAEVKELTESSEFVTTHVSFSRPLPMDIEAAAFDAEGRVDGELLASILPTLEAEFYLCGPIAFMAELTNELERLGVSSQQIHSESFGPG